MNISKILLSLILFFFISGCSYLMIGRHPNASSYQYYDKDFKLSSDSILKTDGFYFCKIKDSLKGEDYYSYLRFYVDGRLNYKITRGEPEIIKESYWPFNDVYGYYKLKGYNIAYELKSNYSTYRHGEGIIKNDTLNIKVFDKRSNGDTIYYSKYVFHEGFAR